MALATTAFLVTGLGGAWAQEPRVGAPTVTAVRPSSGAPRGGMVVTLTGSGFTGASRVMFGPTAGTSMKVISASTITVVSPARPVGVVNVRVVARSGTSALAPANRFTYVSSPSISGVSPALAAITGRVSVTITGARFVGVTAVTFGSAKATSYTVTSSTSLVAMAPAAAVAGVAGVVDVRVTTRSGTSPLTTADRFTYAATGPVLRSLMPSSGPVEGGPVTISGTGFTGVTAVRFGTVDAAFRVISDTEITTTAPVGAPGRLDVTVTGPDGTSPVSAASGYTYTWDGPTVTSVDPAAGPAEGGTPVTITGAQLTGATGVLFGAVAATSVVVISDSEVSAVAPAGSLGGVDVVVQTPLGDSLGAAAGRFSYVAPTSGSILATGSAHTCSITPAGGVECWGWNGHGQLGDATTTSKRSRTPVVGLASGVTAISAAGSTTCALHQSGEVRCWGWNAFGQLGDGTRTDRPTPAAVADLADATSVSVGNGHVCALSRSRGAVCWGWNAYGQLGDGTTVDRLTPTRVAGAPLTSSAVSAGDQHTCMTTTAGALACWGDNARGQLGDGTNDRRLLPVPVIGLGSGVTVVSAGVLHTCAVRAGATLCWGRNGMGQVGDGTTTSRNEPAVVGQLGAVGTQVDADGYSCAVSAGIASCWGDNTFGGVGDGSMTMRTSGVVVRNLPVGVSAVSVGNDHACAIDAANRAWCWGDNAQGQLGDGTTADRLTAVPVAS